MTGCGTRRPRAGHTIHPVGRTSWMGLACVALACAMGPALLGAQAVERFDSAGIEIVRSGPHSSGAPSPLTLSRTPTLTIGALDGADPYLFTHIWGAVRTTDGRIVVVEASDHEIRVFDRAGRHQATFGGRGGGPEEFGGPPWLELLEDGTLLVWDPGHYRISRYTVEGELLEQETIRERVLELGITPFPNGIVWATSPSGVLLWKGPIPPRRAVGLQESYSATIRIAEDGSSTDLGSRLSGRTFVIEHEGGGYRGMGDLLGPMEQAALGAEGDVWISDARRFVLRQYDEDGRLHRLVQPRVARLPVTPELERGIREELPRLSEGLGVSLRSLETAIDAMPPPDSIPAVGALVRDTRGRMWVGMRSGHSWQRRTMDTYHLLDPSGVWLGSIEMPPGVHKLLFADDTHLVVAAMDDFDVQYVRVYELSGVR